MKLSEYITKWDEIICSYLTDQTITMSYGIYVQSDFMPEPYMGDPTNSSFVIVNLNPGGGTCHSCYQQRAVVGTLINKVDMNGYSKAVKDFPYLREEKTVGLKRWNDSPGRKWWMGKERWIKHMLSVCDSSYHTSDPIPERHYPFAVELFGWHTKAWPNNLNKKMEKGGILGKNIYDEVIEPLHEAIQKSKFKLAFCVGCPIGQIIGSFNVFSKRNSEPIQPIKSIQRFYDIYHDGKDCYLINTWAQGGNTYPKIDFEKGEENIYKTYCTP